ncbi:phage tail protein [Vibrio sp. 10N.286.49.B3]|uniref:DUF3319 domain-containing protein n=1 Tax=Vibrio sp. 10N.286.49.B3 TaxID=1880855 RepID=UPI000C84BF80|nr:DUF3319 domain-containing protein [Vibrio sp. 10N.286.49.B3]PMH41432.1 phage tail protein [Vibrio sp. 10N.286.49.B3]
MSLANYRGFNLKTVGSTSSVWQVRIKEQVLQGNLAAVKKSIDWWCDTASLVHPKEFSTLSPKTQGPGTTEIFNGFTLKNDTGEVNSWYCMFNGRLIKGGKGAIQKHIEAYLIAKKKAEQVKK